ncbi:MAG: hypothetical protein ACK4UN_20835, partial [Limisphaerales bacterium]
VVGDASVLIPGLSHRVGPTSTITSAFILNAVLVGAATLSTAAGKPPEVYASVNSDGAVNDALLKKYKGVIPNL